MKEIIGFAPFFASFVAIIAMLSGLWQFKKTQRLVRETKAIDLFLKFNELNEQLSKIESSENKSMVFWQSNAMLAITETIFKLTEGDDSWRETVKWMLEIQDSFLIDTGINSKSYSPAFVSLMKEIIPSLNYD